MVMDRYEMADGSSPEVTPLALEVGRRLPLSAFTLLAGGPARARAWVKGRVGVQAHGAPAALVQRVQEDMVRQVSGNLQLVARLEAARPLTSISPTSRWQGGLLEWPPPASAEGWTRMTG